MNDSEIIWAFDHTLGEGIIGRDDVDHKDQTEILKILENTAERLMPFAHKYSSDSNCKRCSECKNYKKSQYGGGYACIHYEEKCYRTVNRPLFEKKKGIRKG